MVKLKYKNIIFAFLLFSMTFFGQSINTYDSIRKEVVFKLAKLDTLINKHQYNYDVTYIRITRSTAELFLKYAKYDIGVQDQYEKAFKQRPFKNLYKNVQLENVAIKELEEVDILLQKEISSFQKIISGKIKPKKAPLALDYSKIYQKGAYWMVNKNPVFLTNLVNSEVDRNKEYAFSYGAFENRYFGINALKGDEKIDNKMLNPFKYQSDYIGQIALNNLSLPKWMLKEYPNIKDGARPFTNYDIDHPVIRKVWKKVFKEFVPEAIEKNYAKLGYTLANEPNFNSAKGTWGANTFSANTILKFKQWLKKHYNKDLNQLNKNWNSSFKNWIDVFIDLPINANLRGKPIWYDWCLFNKNRVTEWYQFLKDGIKTHDADAKVRIKMVLRFFTEGTSDHGMDFEQLANLQDILGAIGKLTDGPTVKTKKSIPWENRYTVSWRDMVLTYDFFKSVAPLKPIFDGQFHGLMASNWINLNLSSEYVRLTYWLAHLHGMASNDTWFWGRNSDGNSTKKGLKRILGSPLTQPYVLNSYAQTLKELNAIAPEMVAFAKQSKKVRLFYSETSSINDKSYMEGIYETYKSLYHQGIPLGFATEEILKSPNRNSEIKVLIISAAHFVKSSEIEAVQKYILKGGAVIVVGKSVFGKNQYGIKHSKSLKNVTKIPNLQMITEILKPLKVYPKIQVVESNENQQKGVVWRNINYKGNHLVLMLNLGSKKAGLEIFNKKKSVKTYRDYLTNTYQTENLSLKPMEVKIIVID